MRRFSDNALQVQARTIASENGCFEVQSARFADKPGARDLFRTGLAIVVSPVVGEVRVVMPSDASTLSGTRMTERPLILVPIAGA